MLRDRQKDIDRKRLRETVTETKRNIQTDRKRHKETYIKRESKTISLATPPNSQSH